ncbi:MAG: DUF3105 domain-containing protein [Actinomycetota bacterium]
MSKKLEEKQQRRLAEERKRQEAAQAARKRNLMTVGIAVLIGALVVALIIANRPEDPGADFGVAADEAGCTEIETHEDEGRGHTEDVAEDVQYGTQPPTSGRHAGSTTDIGFHSEPVQEELVVHNLEHGEVAVWYSPDAPAEVLDQLETYVNDAGIGMLAVPYDNVPDGYNFSLSAWGASQSCEEVSGEVLAEFRERFQGKGPESVGIPPYEPES